MTLNKVKLSDSLSLSYTETERFKSGILTLTIPLPLSAKSSAYAMLLAGILKRGTEKYPDITALNKRLDELYASSLDVRSARIGKNLAIILTADMLDECYIPDGTDVLDGVLELIEQTLIYPRLENGVFPEAIFRQEKRFLIDSINSSVNNTRAYASLRLAELMLASDKEFPTVEELKNILDGIDASELTDYFMSTVRKAPIEVFYVGNTAKEVIEKKLMARFSLWRADMPFSPTLPIPEPKCPYRAESEMMPVSQGKLAMGFKVGTCIGEGEHKNHVALLFNEIFGGSAMSKLFMNVREKLSLCYYCSSSYNQYMGTLTVSCGIEHANRALAENAILSELEDIRNGKISEAEFHAAITALENSYRQIYDNPYDIQSFFGNRAFFGFSESIESAREGVLSVTPDEVSELAREIVLDSVFYVEPTGGEEDLCDE